MKMKFVSADVVHSTAVCSYRIQFRPCH